MSEMLQPLVDELDAIIESIKANISTAAPLSLTSGTWSFPGVNKQDLISRVKELRDAAAEASEPNPDSQAIVTGLIERLTFLKDHTVPQILSQGGAAVFAFLATLDAVEKSLMPVMIDVKAQALKNSQAVKKATNQIRSVETRIKALTPRTKSLEDMVGRIEKAHDAADQLPTDLETLGEAQKQVSDLLKGAEVDKAKIEDVLSSITEMEDSLKSKSEEADAVLQQCVTAYSSATSLGLAAAFSERSKALGRSTLGWVGGLIVALLAGSFFGSSQLRNLADALSNPQAQGLTVGVNLILALISVGGPVWFAWLSTKQIGQRFRLSEDYAFKASISRAYEGYRREASRIDPSMEKQLLGSALARLDEQPLRLVERDSFGSPWHELMSSDVIKDAVKSVPGFLERITSMASAALHPKSGTAASVPKPPVASNDTVNDGEEAKV
nr:hypothetical protein [uncultured Pseudomonas sp.]